MGRLVLRLPALLRAARAGRAGRDAQVPVRPDPHRARAERHRLRAQRPAPAGRRLDHRLQAEPDLRRRRRVPRVDVIHLHHGVWLINGAADVRGRRGEDRDPRARAATAGATGRATVGDEPHDPQPHADADRRLHHLRPRVRPRRRRPQAAGMQEVRTMWLDVMGVQAYPVFDVHRGAGGRDGRYTYPRESKQPGVHAQPLRACRRTACWSAPPGTCTPAACGPTSCSSAAGKRVRLFRSQREVLRARRRGVVGRGDGGDAAGLARRRQARRRARGVGDLRLQARVVVRGDGDHAGRCSTPAGPGRTRSS